MTNDLILQAVSDVTGVSKEDILMDSKLPNAKEGRKVFARQLCVTFAYTQNPKELKQIAYFFNRCYANVLYSVKTLKNDIERDRDKRRLYERVQHELSLIKWKRSDVEFRRAITDDLSEVQYGYQDISEEALKFQTNMTNIIV